MKEEKYAQELTIKQWAEEDRPREKLMQKGTQALTDAELLAILLREGTKTAKGSLSAVDVAKILLKTANHDLHKLARMSLKELTKIQGIGEAKAITIISAMELGRRRKEADRDPMPSIKSGRDVCELMRPHLTDLPHEELWVILLSRSFKVMQKVKISSGGVAGTVADPKMIFKPALEQLASFIILVHNHPSGNLTPSQADINLTKKVAQGGKLLEIPLIDHVIFADGGYYSFADEGMMD